jgi:NADH-quinone oxidoreductase subunit J
MTAAAFLFWVIAGVTGISAVMVLVTQNIVRAAAWLLFTLAGVSALYFLLGADFVGATQLIVYVGGTLVLVVFGVMLTAQGPFVSMKSGAIEWAGTILVGLLLFGVLAATTALYAWPTQSPEDLDAATSTSTTQLGLAFLGVPEATPPGSLTGVPRQLDSVSGKTWPAPTRTRVAYLLPFEIVSVHLLVVLIGAAYLARAKRRSPKAALTSNAAPLSGGGA